MFFPNNNGYNECVTNDNYKIMFASVQKPYGSIDICSYVSEIDDGVNYGQYGYNETTLWVLDGCGGVFNVCYAGNYSMVNMLAKLFERFLMHKF